MQQNKIHFSEVLQESIEVGDNRRTTDLIHYSKKELEIMEVLKRTSDSTESYHSKVRLIHAFKKHLKATLKDWQILFYDEPIGHTKIERKAPEPVTKPTIASMLFTDTPTKKKARTRKK